MRISNNFKRLFVLALSLIMVFSLVACDIGTRSDDAGEDSGMKAAQDFYDKVSESQDLLDELADDIYRNWYDRIYKDKFSENINIAIASALADNSENVDKIEALDGEIADLFKAAKETGAIVTAEEHSVIGGLGSAVSELLSEECPTPIKKVGVEDVFGMSGPAAELLDIFGLNAENICKKAKEAISMK